MFGALSFIPFFAQASLGSNATAAGSLLTPLMLSWVVLSIVGGRLLLKIGFRTTVMIGLSILIIGFGLLSSYHSDMPRIWLYVDLILMGSGLGLTVLTLLLAVQQAVERPQLGIATSLSQFARSIGGAIGVAIIGMIMSASFTANLNAVAAKNGGVLTPEMAARFSANPNALIEKKLQTELSPDVLAALRDAMTGALHNAFWMATALSALALVSVFWLPGHRKKQGDPAPEACTHEAGERMVVAEMATLDAEHEPAAVAADNA
jgi:MFS family permease